MESVIEVVYVVDGADKKKLMDLVAVDPYAPLSFGRVAPQLKEMEGKVYMYIKADDKFFKWADENLKSIPSAKRAEKADSERIIKMIKDEEESAASGFGGLFE
jgi:hypothetical protein